MRVMATTWGLKEGTGQLPPRKVGLWNTAKERGTLSPGMCNIQATSCRDPKDEEGNGGTGGLHPLNDVSIGLCQVVLMFLMQSCYDPPFSGWLRGMG